MVHHNLLSTGLCIKLLTFQKSQNGNKNIPKTIEDVLLLEVKLFLT